MSPTRFGLSDELVEQFCEVFARYPEIDRVLLYGSRARGDHQAQSDIDLTLEGPRLGHQKSLTIAGELDDIYHPYLIDLSLKSTLTSEALLQQIQKDGQVFYEKTPAP